MNWQIIILIVASIFLAVALAKKIKGGRVIARFSPYKRKLLVFATPHRAEMILISLYFIFFFIADLAQNKFLDLGTDYKVIVFWNITALALDVWIIFLILFHLTLMGLFLMSLRSKNTHHYYDIIVGVIAFFGVAILLAGVVNQIYSQNIHFLFMNMRSIDFYHIGVYMEMLAGIYWTFTK
jgi:hypothetical protein